MSGCSSKPTLSGKLTSHAEWGTRGEEPTTGATAQRRAMAERIGIRHRHPASAQQAFERPLRYLDPNPPPVGAGGIPWVNGDDVRRCLTALLLRQRRARQDNERDRLRLNLRMTR